MKYALKVLHVIDIDLFRPILRVRKKVFKEHTRHNNQSSIQARNQRPTCGRHRLIQATLRPYSGTQPKTYRVCRHRLIQAIICQGETPYIRYEGTLRIREIVFKAHTQHNSLKPYSGTHSKILHKGIDSSRSSSIILELQQSKKDSQSRTEQASIVLFSFTHETYERSDDCEFNETTMSYLVERKSRRSEKVIHESYTRAIRSRSKKSVEMTSC